MPPHVARVWGKFVKGDQQYRDRKLKMHVPPLDQMPPHVATVWSKFVKGDQQYR
eukprot:CAMPEP_0113384568 /NCGR_PEP_ID=MMETSP0013_2-20120614/6961_1 /TAXON_ID=2843 ORGANISM="Skeletonema costatum, Strain 1716" /NCGR_SAMPLE_ID=MMETSP0013_2 /ASSEMBLY_ACC=CAM_ASM_000158 /LENGTH=53 /DNA_ID=CAMNT_0000267183 /DNA_START=1 /DNA_END=159 /DNA_ORIENTATION=+ /assembly_acc=CAM_ASM_000158